MTASNEQEPRSLATDTLSASLLLLVVAQVLQRSIGLGRNILFCGLLADEELGRWSLTFNFLMLAAPLVVLGLPGSFGRYVEHYRQRGQLRSFLIRIGGVTLLATLLSIVVLLMFPAAISSFVFGDPSLVHLTTLLAFSLTTVIGFNFLVELFTALRLVRFASIMQLVSSMGFAAGGVILLYSTTLAESGVVLAYGGASLIAVFIGVFLMVHVWSSLPTSETPLTHQVMWSKLIPFAGWLWAANLVGNLFEFADQFMLKHFSGLPASAADAMIGQYYSSRVIPVLLVALATVASNSLLPHLTHDWEAGRRDAVRTRLQLAVKIAAVFFTFAGSLVLIAAPLLFGWALGGRYDAGMSVLPTTLAYCVWFCLTCVALSYLLCAEVAHLGSIALFCGLCVNVALNYWLAPIYGLNGVVIATAAANAVALLCVFWLSRRKGMVWDLGIYLVAALPLLLLLGGLPALSIIAIIAWSCWKSGWIFNAQEFSELRGCVDFLQSKLQGVLAPWQPARVEEAQC